MNWQFVMKLAALWFLLSGAYVGLCRFVQEPVEWAVLGLIAFILVPIGAAKAARLRGDEKVELTARSLTGPKGLIADVAKSLEKGRAGSDGK